MWTYILSRTDYSGGALALMVPVPIVVMHCIELTSNIRSAEIDHYPPGPNDLIFENCNNILLRSMLPSCVGRSKVFYLDFASGWLALHFVRV